MRYCGFATRDYLILNNILINKNSSLLEIGVGLGSIVDMIIGKVKEYCGVDIARELIDYLRLVYKNNNSLKFYCLDVCQNSASLNKKFDVVFSADTLEHVESPLGFFSFIKKHLKSDGIVLITFPNESKDKHHGISWFDNKKELLEIIDRARLEATAFFEVKETIWHRAVRNFFWGLPKSLVLKNHKLPQTFEQTTAFKITQFSGAVPILLALYTRMITRLAALFKLYEYYDIKEDIKNKTLLLRLKHK